MLPYQYILFYPILYFPCPSTLIQHLHDSVPNVLSWLLFQFSSVTQSCPTLCNPMDCSTPGFPVLHYFPEFAQTHVHWVNDAIQPSHPLSPPSPPALNLPSIRVFSSESSLHMRCPRYWSFSFSISPSSEYSGLISLRIDSFDLLAVQGTLKSLLQHHNSVLRCSAFFRSNCHIHTWLLYKLLKWRKDFQIYFVLFQLLWWQILYIFKYGIALYIC